MAVQVARRVADSFSDGAVWPRPEGSHNEFEVGRDTIRQLLFRNLDALHVDAALLTTDAARMHAQKGRGIFLGSRVGQPDVM
jgi:hypothetical protein